MLSKFQHSIIIIICCCLNINVLFAANSVQPTDELQEIIKRLDKACEYRKDWRGMGKTHSELIKAYTSKDNDYGVSPQKIFEGALEQLLELLKKYLQSPTEELSLADQEILIRTIIEALREFMIGQSLIGNDDLIKGLRARFSKNDDTDQLELLRNSAKKFQKGVDFAFTFLRKYPQIFESENTTHPLETLFGLLTQLINRCAMANNSVGKRIFFIENTNESGRKEAKNTLKSTANYLYFQSALLAETQSEDDFEDNNGSETKIQILDAQRLFDDILSGFNPLKLAGDFVPMQSVEQFLKEAKISINEAIGCERDAKNSKREYDQDKEALRSALERQQLNYLNQIEGLSGLDIEEGNYNLVDKESKEQFFKDVEENMYRGSIGQLRLQVLDIESANISVKQAYDLLTRIPEEIRIEVDRCQEITKIIMDTGREVSALSLAEGIASSINISLSESVSVGINSSGIPEFSVSMSKTVSFNPNAIVLGLIRGKKDMLQAVKESKIMNTNCGATIKQKLLQMATAQIDLERAMAELKRQLAKLDELKSLLKRTVRNFISARTSMDDSYFLNPAYRLDRDQLIEAAEQSFETAMVQSYYAAKALEYLWTEKCSNPIMRLDGGLPVPLPEMYDFFVNAESIFSVQFAERKSPSLGWFYLALQAWNNQLHQLRTPAGDETSYSIISIKNDILHYNRDDESENQLYFSDFIEKHRVKGRNPNHEDLTFDFSIGMADEMFFPLIPNVKIIKMEAELISQPGRFIAADKEKPYDPAKVEFYMTGEATNRSFFAEIEQDDFIHFDLSEGRTLEKSPFGALINASIDGYPIVPPNEQLKNHSPAVSRWICHINMNNPYNRGLKLEYLNDIQLKIYYRYGKPGEINFP